MKIKSLLLSLAAASLLLGALPVLAAGESVHYTTRPDRYQYTTGDTVTLSLRCDTAPVAPTAARFVFTLGDGYVFSQVKDGADIQGGELSYNYTGEELILLYLDNAGGNSPLEAGGEVASITLQVGQAGEGQPLQCQEVSSSGVQGEEVISQDSTVTVESVTVEGAAVDLPAAQPSQTESLAEAPVTIDTGTQEPTPVPTQAPGVSSTPLPADGTAQPEGEAGAQETAAPAPTPLVTTLPNGERVAIYDQAPEPVDRTQEVLESKPATTPNPATTVAEQAATPVGGISPAVAAVVAVVVVIVGGGLMIWRRRKEK